jgi:hypothetical protein
MSDPRIDGEVRTRREGGARYYLYRWVEDPKATNHDPWADRPRGKVENVGMKIVNAKNHIEGLPQCLRVEGEGAPLR